MTKLEYGNKVAELVNGIVREVEKANGVILTGIETKRDSTIKPIVYIDAFYNEGKSLKEAANAVRKVFEADYPSFDLDILRNFDNVKPLLRARLYNKATKAEVYRSTAEYGFDDLIIIPYVQLQPNAAFKVTEQRLEMWGIDLETVLDAALENVKTDVSVLELQTLLASLIGEEPPMADMGPLTVVVTNGNKMYGAVSVLFAKERLQAMFPNGYVVMPSSVHEVIVTDRTEEDLSGLVTDVNETEVNPEEVLSNQTYSFAV